MNNECKLELTDINRSQLAVKVDKGALVLTRFLAFLGAGLAGSIGVATKLSSQDSPDDYLIFILIGTGLVSAIALVGLLATARDQDKHIEERGEADLKFRQIEREIVQGRRDATRELDGSCKAIERGNRSGSDTHEV